MLDMDGGLMIGLSNMEVLVTLLRGISMDCWGEDLVGIDSRKRRKREIGDSEGS